jgi:hypothetical protein
MSNRLGGTPIPLDCAYPDYLKETIPRSRLGYATNNVYPEFPPKMSDGRSLISSWNPESVLDNKYAKEHEKVFRDGAPMNANWMYRRYMQKNANDIMAANFKETANDTGSSIPLTKEMEHTKPRNAPALFTSLTDPTRPMGYEDSNLKSLYLTREQLNARKYAPVIN